MQAEQSYRERFVGDMVELMTIAPPPTHAPPSPRAINNQMRELASHAQSSPLLRSNVVRASPQTQNRSTSERHISENQVQSSLLRIPETRPFSPLTYGSDSGSHGSNMDDIDHVPSLPVGTQGVNEETDGAVPPFVTTFSDGDSSKITEGHISHESEARVMSPTLTEVYERARQGSHSTSARSHDSEHRTGSGHGSEPGGSAASGIQSTPQSRESIGLAIASEDPLWYKSREPCQVEADPMPYETVVRSPPLVTASGGGSVPVSPRAVHIGEGRRRIPPLIPMTSLTSPDHSDISVASSSKRSSLSRSSSRVRSPTSPNPASIISPGSEHERKHSLPAEWSKRHGSSSTTNPLYSTSDVVSAKGRSRKKHHNSFNSPKDGHPLPPLPPSGPIHTSPLPPLPYPPGDHGSASQLKKRSVVGTESSTMKHTHFTDHMPIHHHQTLDTCSRESPLRTAAALSVSPPLCQAKSPHGSPQVRAANGMSLAAAPSSPESEVGVKERRSVSCSNSPAQPRQKKKRALERDDSYHSQGPSAEGRKVNQIIRCVSMFCDTGMM